MQDLTITAPVDSPNTDGIDPGLHFYKLISYTFFVF